MVELSENARRLLAHERAAEGPSQATRERVRKGVALALAAGAGAAPSTASAAASPASAGANEGGLFASVPGKLLLAVGLAALLAAGGMALRSTSPPPSALAEAVSPAPKPAQLASPPQPPQPPIAASIDPPQTLEQAPPQTVANGTLAARPVPWRGARPGVGNSAAPGDLRAEMLLLAAASNALERGDLAAARTQLAQYRAQFSRGQLKREERGLDALTRCLAREPGAPARARRYLQGAQASVLAARLETACREVPQP